MISGLLGAAVALALAHLAFGVGLNPRKEVEAEADLQRMVRQTDDASTRAKSFQRVGGLSAANVCTDTPVSVTISLQLQGAPVRLRIWRRGVREGRRLTPRRLWPGPIRLNPARGGSPVSFTFVDPSRGEGAMDYEVQWRSPTGRRVTMKRGSMVLGFSRAPDQICPG